MNRIELGQWLQYHDSLFPGYLNWFQTGEPAAISVRMEAWGRRLGSFSASHVQQASNALFEAREKPRYHSEHLDWLCNYLRPRPLLNQTDVSVPRRCGLCNDTGIVTVIFHRQRYTVRGVPLPDNTGPAACKCSKGTWLNDRRDGARLEVYDASSMDLPQPVRLSPEERRAIVSRLRQRSPALAAAMLRLIDRHA